MMITFGIKCYTTSYKIRGEYQTKRRRLDNDVTQVVISLEDTVLKTQPRHWSDKYEHMANN